MRYRTREAAAFLGLAPKTLEFWRVRGTGPRYRKLGRVVVYDERDLEEFLERGARTSTSEPGGAPHPAA